MKLPRDIDADELVKALQRLGYRIVRQQGSHIRLQCDTPNHAVTVPAHRPLKVGTLAGILADVGEQHRMERTQLIAALFH
jgi:predicted RNA binding protein YcfA (HicA-like mRNA interferase family)